MSRKDTYYFAPLEEEHRGRKVLIWIVILLAAAVLLLMLMIFFFSAQNGDESHELSGMIVESLIRLLFPTAEQMPADSLPILTEQLEFFIRKLGHFSEYATLGFFSVLMFESYGCLHFRPFGWGLATLYAGTDELHQMFSGGRSPLLTDVLLDSCGAGFGLALACLLLHLLFRHSR